MHIRIEVDRGDGWTLRNEGHADVTPEQVVAQVEGYTVGHHRVFLDGKLYATLLRSLRSHRVTTTIHEGQAS